MLVSSCQPLSRKTQPDDEPQRHSDFLIAKAPIEHARQQVTDESAKRAERGVAEVRGRYSPPREVEFLCDCPKEPKKRAEANTAADDCHLQKIVMHVADIKRVFG
jgi:hypothetical protein